ncbi:MAG: glutamate-1-semialdehyde 2,1-aminomutase [bacterium]|nr:glutamate-1-semialdehyde 2,1-aminomutase [bacterium]
MTLISKNQQIYDKASKVLVGGVNAPIRAFSLIGITPIYISSAVGPYLTDFDNKNYISFISGWGSIILGDAYPDVINNLKKQLEKGIYYGLSNEYEYLLAELILEAFNFHDMVRYTNSGTEANMLAIRLAKAITGRNKIIKFDGGYHGSIDYLLIESGSMEFGEQIPSSAGVSKRLIKDTVSLPYNDIEILTDFLNKYGNDIAAIIVEPIQTSNMLIKATNEFLIKLRELATKYSIILIFDEVSTAFRIRYGSCTDIKPDITVIGKVIGGGFPIAAILSKKEFMEVMAPIGSMYHSGIFTGHPISTFTGYQVLNIIKSIDNFYKKLEQQTLRFTNIINQLKDHLPTININHVNSMFSLYFSNKKVESIDDIKELDIMTFIDFYKLALEEGVLFAPHPTETNYLNFAHDAKILDLVAEKLMKISNKLNY